MISYYLTRIFFVFVYHHHVYLCVFRLVVFRILQVCRPAVVVVVVQWCSVQLFSSARKGNSVLLIYMKTRIA